MKVACRVLFLGLLPWIFGCSLATVRSGPEAMPSDGFVSLQKIDPSITLEIRYYGVHNFLGRRARGYNASKCILTKKAAEALASVQKELRQFDLALKVYDCYRPRRAVDDFAAWARDLSDTKMKKEFYPNVPKTELFKEGYIAEKSGHSRGSTVDLTIVPLPAPDQAEYKEGQDLAECYLPQGRRSGDNGLDMGTGFDCFDPLAHTASPTIGRQQHWNRLLLLSVMEKHGFRNLPEEWWHYTLKDEPFKDRYFDFAIQ
jgi:D-alanyl-D-alanine dipeptidase